MRKIDRLGWAAGMTFLSHGVRVGIRANQTEVLEQLLDRLPPGWKRSKSQSPIVPLLYSIRVGGSSPRRNIRLYNLLYWNSTRLARSMDLDEVFERFEDNLHHSGSIR
ncbi:hypothetical protein [Candidatus Entotheonella palauensis]|uniref:hypothetical protein n=1 Tax=Candidatus Entotheonella palauensis TaxID=93172 RepID=UPI000B7EDE1D|nr:hypothetical protein [Candidatus Entotheonella palauensis]